jgi:hypothetical protein
MASSADVVVGRYKPCQEQASKTGRGVTAVVDQYSNASRSAARRRLATALGLAVLGLVLAIPNHPADTTAAALLVFPFELLAITAALLAAGKVPALVVPVRVAVTGALLISVVVKLADLGMITALNRTFNFAYDLPLIHAGWMVFLASSSPAKAIACLAVALGAFCGLAAVVWSSTGALTAAPVRRRFLVPLSLLAAAPLLVGGQQDSLPVSALTTRVLFQHVEAALQAKQDIAALAREAADDPYADAPPGVLLDGLRGRDVIFAFVESYGRSTLDNPRYAPTTRAALSDIAAELAAAGLAARSAWLTSPTFGGQSWLAHSTLLSGLWIDTEGRYGALMQSRRKTLLKLGAENGWRSVGVMPAITEPWPEAAFYGYDKVLAAADLGYEGLPFNWVTMPDQYTWSAFERLELAPSGRKPIFAEVALISSHAPWTPIPKLVPWEDVGDGRVFDAQASSGESPERLWRDKDRVRDQFRQSIDYALRTVGEFAVRRMRDAPLIVVLGDHQPAAFVSGTEANRDVPIHVIGDAATIARLDDWRWAAGMTPSEGSPVWRMDEFRNRFLDAFSTSAMSSAGKDHTT